MSTTSNAGASIFHITFIFLLLILLPRHVASAGRGHGYVSAPSSVIKKTTLEPRDQNFVTRKGPFFHGKEVSGCMPKGRRRSSAPSHYVNNQPLFKWLGCSTASKP
ncbi:hypothetical protein Tco_1194551 [Tanacetum coccineum]